MKTSDWRIPRIAVAILAVIVLLMASVGSSAASPKYDPDEVDNGGGRVGICHETGKGSIYIEVSESGYLNGHSKHGDKEASGPGDCERNGEDEGSGQTSVSPTGTSVTSASISANPASPRNVGTTVTLTASSSPNISTEYRWWMLAPNNSSWADMSGWGGNAFSWNTSGLAAGTYQISVWARAKGSSSDAGYYQVNPMIYYTLTVPTGVSSATISANPASAQNVGTTVTLTASSSPNISTEYRWWMLAPNATSWADMSGWGSSNTFSWNTSGLAAGTYQISVWARATGSSSDAGYYQVNPMIYYELKVPVTAQPTAQPTAQTVAGTTDSGGNGRGNGRGHNGR